MHNKIYANNYTFKFIDIFYVKAQNTTDVEILNKLFKCKTTFAYVPKFQKFHKEMSRYEREEIGLKFRNKYF